MRWRELQNGIKPAVPYLFLFDDTGNQTFTTGGEFHTWDTTKIITEHFTYTDDTDRVYLATQSAGLFKVTFECSFITYDEDDDLQITTQLFKNGSFLDGAQVVCSVTGGVSQDDKVKNCQSLTFIVYLEKDDYIQVKSTTDANSVDSLSDTSRLIVEFIPMKGWDNGSAGRTDYKGGVMR